MIEDKKRKTRRVSKKVKKMHEEVVSKGIVGATPPELKTGGGMLDVYKVDFRKGGDVVNSQVTSELGLQMMSLRDILTKIQNNPGSHYRIEQMSVGSFIPKVYRIDQF